MIQVTWLDIGVYLSCTLFLGWCFGMATYDWLRQRQERKVLQWESLVRDWEMETHEHGSMVDGHLSRIRWLPRDTQDHE